MSVGGSPGYGCDPSNGEQSICDCLSCTLERIASANEYIGQVLNDRLNRVCDNVDECADEILEAIKKRIEGPRYNCEECQRMVANGLAGTLEYAVRCANQTCEECVASCSLVNEGECCTTCGQRPCVCKDGVCVPVEKPEEEETKKYVGWCNVTTKVIVVTKQGEPGPGVEFSQVALADTEIVAFNEAESYCKSIPGVTKQPEIGRVPDYGTSSLPFCDLTALVNGNTLNIAAGAVKRFFQTGGFTSLVTAFEDIGAFGITAGDVTSAMNGLGRRFSGMPAFYAEVAAQRLPPMVGCENPTFQDAMRLMITAQLFQQQSGANIIEWLLPYRYAMHAACRQIHLNADQARAAFLADVINYDGLQGLSAINGMCPEDVDWSLLAARSKPVPLQLAIMRHRNIISQAVYQEKMRQLGFLEPSVSEDLYKITFQVPPLTDLIRLMVRDTDDPNIPDWKQSDELFAVKYGKQLRDWGEQQGIPELYAKYAWRAHWTIPSPGQLFEFYHRLRNKPELWTAKGPLEDITQALIQQDILPRWHKSYLAVSFNPMRLRDIRRSFQVGTLTEAEAKDAFTQLGYSDETVDLMVKFLVRLRDNSVRSHSAIKQWYRFQLSKADATAELKSEGIPDDVIQRAFRLTESEFAKTPFAKAYVRGELSRGQLATTLSDAGVSAPGITRIIQLLSALKRSHPAVKDFETGLIDREQAINQMTADGFDTSIAQNIIDEASRIIERSFVVTCQHGIKRRYIMGELDQQEAQNELVARKTTAAFAARLVSWWECELKSGEKHVSVNTLCGWLSRGSISAADFQRRLIRLGYDEADAARLIEDCLISVSVKRTREAKREAREQAVEQNRIARILEKQAREQFRSAQQMERQKEKAAATRGRRQKALLSASEKVNATCKCGLSEAFDATRAAYTRVQSDFALTADESLQVVLLASDGFGENDLAGFASVVDKYAQELVDAAISGKTARIELSNGNGKSG
jgi:hypothetical protein